MGLESNLLMLSANPLSINVNTAMEYFQRKAHQKMFFDLSLFSSLLLLVVLFINFLAFFTLCTGKLKSDNNVNNHNNDDVSVVGGGVFFNLFSVKIIQGSCCEQYFAGI